MRMIVCMALAIASPAMAQDAAPDAADGYPLEVTYADTSADLPREGIMIKPAPDVLLDAKGQVLRSEGGFLSVGKTVIFRVDDMGFMTDIRFVSANAQLHSGEIKASLESVGGTTRFTILNSGPLAYNYRLGIPDPAAQPGQPATALREPTCTLVPNVAAFEMWATPMNAVLLSRFTPAPDGEMTCK